MSLVSAAMASKTKTRKESRTTLQGRNRRCRALGGMCKEVWKPCPGDLALSTEPGKPYCRDDRRCCYPEIKVTPEECCDVPECFFLYASSQCFCVINATAPGANWTDARSECITKGNEYEQKWNLAHPYDAVALRSLLVQEYGNFDHLWLNAKANGNDMIWMDNSVVIMNANPLFPFTPSFPLGNSLELRASEAELAADPRMPYFSDTCSDKHQHILCQRRE